MERIDVIVVGGGPAGLTAAIYLSRFRLRTLVLDRGGSRASLIPLSRNHAGFPEGIAGVDLVDRMRRQAAMYGAVIRTEEAIGLKLDGDGITVLAGERRHARAVLLATGVTNTPPPMAPALHAEALRTGRLRYCPVCDGFEVTDKRVAVFGTGARGVKEAVFLRDYTADVTLLASEGRDPLNAEEQGELCARRIRVVDAQTPGFALVDDGITVSTGEGVLSFDSVYPALGSAIHSDLARSLGADTEEVGCIVVDRHQRTSVRGLYAAGDVVLGLDQISHAMGEGGVAATTIRNDLAGGAF